MSEVPETNTSPARRSRRKTKTVASLQPPSASDLTSTNHQGVDTGDAPASPDEEADDLAALARQIGQMADDPRIEQRLIASYFAGPLPPPSDMALYKNVMPDLPERIVSHHEWQLRQADAEAEHRRALQRMSLESKIRTQERGQIIAACVIFADFGIVVFTLVKDLPAVAAAFGLPGLAFVLVVFLSGTEFGRRSGLQQAAAFRDALGQFLPRRSNVPAMDYDSEE